MNIRGASRSLVLVAALVVIAGIGLGSWLLLRDGGESVTQDRCGQAAAELTVEEDGDALEVGFEIQAMAPGEAWTVVIDRDGEPVFEGERTTDEDAELDVDVVVPTGDGEFTATATPPGGEPCTVSVQHG